VLTAEQLEQVKDWGRYRDVDGDGIPYRTLPGNENPRSAFLSRGTGHNEFAVYSERSSDWQANLDRLTRKHHTARSLVPKPVVSHVPGAAIGIVAYGSTNPAIEEGRDRLSEQYGITASYLRLRALPLEDTLTDFIAAHARIYVVEMNQDGQMHQLVQLHLPDRAGSIRSVRLCDGLPLTAKFVAESILEQENQQ
jgi:2-oxoglutarate ferredoxin oxidoreductase subunit alpha